jgi:hypothetical protein
MDLPEDRLLALSYLQAHATQDEELISLIETTTDHLTLARECAILATIIATTLAKSIDDKQPPATKEILEDLRDVYYDL